MELPTVEAWSYTRGKVSVTHFKLGDCIKNCKNKLYPFLCDPITGYWVEGRVSAETDGSELHPGFLHLFGVVTSTIVFQTLLERHKVFFVFCLNERKNQRLTVYKTSWYSRFLVTAKHCLEQCDCYNIQDRPWKTCRNTCVIKLRWESFRFERYLF